jgi:hypothetical protein
MFSSEVLQALKLTSDDFGIEIEISAQIARAKRWRIYEIGISYYGRTYNEGKKINWLDGFKAVVYLFKFRFQSIRSSRPLIVDPSTERADVSDPNPSKVAGSHDQPVG